MGRSLVIVESPAKAKTINKYLGRNYTVKASYGHIMDLPKKVLGIDIAHGFAPTYEVNPDKTSVVKQLQKAAATADAVYLAGDPDREGEAICAHLAEVLSGPKLEFPTEEEKAIEEADAKGKKGKKKTKKPVKKVVAKGKPVIARKNIFRVMFNEITSKAIKAAFEHPGEINENLVDAQQARRVLDRLVGYKISPLLWDKVRRGLSAGRVQTVALRLIVDREREIRAFEKREYWTIDVQLNAKKPPVLTARFTKKDDQAIEVGDEATAKSLVDQIEGSKYVVHSVTTREKKRNPVAPFITSTLQQESARKLRFSVKRTMMLAQRLYEGVELGTEGSVGLITYMRTDSTRVSSDALDEVRKRITERCGAPFCPPSPNAYKSKKDPEDAHEAIRPTSGLRTPESVASFLQEEELKLYRLIWMRFVGSQMMPAVFDQTTIDVAAKGKDGATYMFRATGSVPKFKGFLEVYEEGKDQKDEDDEELKHRLPLVQQGEELKFKSILPEQHFTEPPPRFNEATLVKELEAAGVGRPSTYASILSTIQEREYVKKEGGKFVPTELGMVVTDLLLESFQNLFDVTYTARMEAELDEIEEGKMDWRAAMSDFYEHFQKDLEYAEPHMTDIKRMEK